jgi:hypothetical protein
MHDARIIPLDGRPHLPQNIRRWLGDSHGRWEGSTLIVETTNYSPKISLLGSAETLHVVERFTRTALDRISYEITLTDPTTWATPWTAVVRLKRTDDKMYEDACHEGNQRVIEDILAGSRRREGGSLTHFLCVTSASATGAPPLALLRSAASMNAMISNVSSGWMGGTPVWKNFTISTTRLR